MITVPQVYYNKYSEVFFHYYEVGGCVWYSYSSMTNMLNNNEDFAKYFWIEKLHDNEKKIFEEEYEDFRHNIRIGKFQYINTSGLFKLLEAHERMSGQIRKEVTQFEFDRGYINKDDSNNHALQINLNMLGNCLQEKDGDYDKLSQDEKIKTNEQINRGVSRLMALAESYPDLKANQNFLELQQELEDTETKIQAARQFYNSTVLSYNTSLSIFPNNIIAGRFNFTPERFFELEEEEKKEVRKAVKVQF